MRWNKYEYNNVYNNEAIRANEINVNKDQDPYPISAFLLLIPSNLGLCYIHWNIFSHQCFVCVYVIGMKNINLPSPCILVAEGSSPSSVLLAKVHLSLWLINHVSFHRTSTFTYCLSLSRIENWHLLVQTLIIFFFTYWRVDCSGLVLIHCVTQLDSAY